MFDRKHMIKTQVAHLHIICKPELPNTKVRKSMLKQISKPEHRTGPDWS